MRPLRLEVEGFTCYRDRQPALDFSALSLFAIAGPTGAGKSSILDAMLYALYGQVPRLKQGITELISHGRDSLSVCLDFEVQGTSYRVTRRVKRRAKGSAQTIATLAELTSAAMEKPLADGVRQVNEEIAKKLGLGYDDFIQTVILPQGEFARFLRAEPRAQREILQHLLRHGVFERMRASAEERRRELDGRLRGLDGQLANYAHATAEELTARDQELTGAQATLASALAAKDVAEADLREMRRLRDLTVEVDQQRQQRAALDVQAPAVERSRVELSEARLAAAVLPRLEALQSAGARAERAAIERDDAAKAAAATAAARDDAAKRRDRAESDAARCDELAHKVRRLDEIAAELDRRTALQASMAAISPDLAASDTELAGAQKAEASAQKQALGYDAQLQVLTKARDAIAFDAALYNSLEALRDDIVHAKALARDRDASAADAEARTLEAARFKGDETAANAAHRTAVERADAAADVLRAAQDALDEGRNRHRAAALRAHLHAGDSCPVCLQVVAAPPLVDTPPELVNLESAYYRAEQRANEADRARQAASEALAMATARRVEAEKQQHAAASAAATRAEALGEAFARLAAAVAGGTPAGGSDVLDSLDRRWSELHTARKERDRHEIEIRDLERARAEARLALASAEAKVTQVSERRERLVQDRARLESELAAVIARIEAVTTYPDPREERKSVAREITRLRDAERGAREALVQAELASTIAAERLKGADTAFAHADAQARATSEAVEQAVAAAAFADARAATDAVRDEARQRELDTAITAFDRSRAAVLQRLVDLEPQVTGREVPAAALADAERRCGDVAARWREADQAVTRLDSDCARLRQEVERRAQLATEREALHASLSVAGELATDLKGDRFQQYLLEEAFKGLVAGASVRMKTISNRYTLEWDSGEFYVVDHDNAGERRRAETLSGGETFMASLCLALQLSDEVLRTSGALQMDSLFIDEGFGTLDADSLSEVTDAIEALRQDAGRLIGVISHRPELTDRLPGCIRIQKGAGESRWELERIG